MQNPAIRGLKSARVHGNPGVHSMAGHSASPSLSRTLPAAALLLGLMAAGCSPDISPNTYSAAAVQQANKADQGVVVGVREVNVRVDGTTGAIVGGAAGGIAGSQAGNGATSAFGALGGSLIGGLIGTGAEHAMGDTKAYEYIVKTSKELVSVTQKDGTPLAIGQRVLVIAGRQARIVPDYTVSLPPETPDEATKGAQPAPAAPRGRGGSAGAGGGRGRVRCREDAGHAGRCRGGGGHHRGACRRGRGVGRIRGHGHGRGRGGSVRRLARRREADPDAAGARRHPGGARHGNGHQARDAVAGFQGRGPWRGRNNPPRPLERSAGVSHMRDQDARPRRLGEGRGRQVA